MWDTAGLPLKLSRGPTTPLGPKRSAVERPAVAVPLISVADNSEPLSSPPRVRKRFEGKACGIPHLAKNERDVGHPATDGGDRAQKRVHSTLHLIAASRWYGSLAARLYWMPHDDTAALNSFLLGLRRALLSTLIRSTAGFRAQAVESEPEWYACLPAGRTQDTPARPT
jgi:hypothetical protein